MNPSEPTPRRPTLGEAVSAELDAIDARGLRRRLRTVDGPQDAVVRIGGRDLAPHPSQQARRPVVLLGFRPVGVLRKYERVEDGVWRDALLMELLAEDFRRA